MRFLILIAVMVFSGCIRQPAKVAIWTESQAVALQNQLIEYGNKLDQAVDLSAESVNAVAKLSEEVCSLRDALQEVRGRTEEEIKSITQSALIPIETLTADQVKQIVTEALAAFECKCQPPAVTQQPAKVEPVVTAPSPFQSAPVVSSVVCSGGVCQPVKATKVYIKPQKTGVFGRIFGR